MRYTALRSVSCRRSTAQCAVAPIGRDSDYNSTSYAASLRAVDELLVESEQVWPPSRTGLLGLPHASSAYAALARGVDVLADDEIAAVETEPWPIELLGTLAGILLGMGAAIIAVYVMCGRRPNERDGVSHVKRD
jgi:hypothetical protein